MDKAAHIRHEACGLQNALRFALRPDLPSNTLTCGTEPVLFFLFWMTTPRYPPSPLHRLFRQWLDPRGSSVVSNRIPSELLCHKPHWQTRALGRSGAAPATAKKELLDGVWGREESSMPLVDAEVRLIAAGTQLSESITDGNRTWVTETRPLGHMFFSVQHSDCDNLQLPNDVPFFSLPGFTLVCFPSCHSGVIATACSHA